MSFPYFAHRPRPHVAVAVTALLVAGCVSDELPPTIWPPPDFSLVVEEVRFEGRLAHVTRRIRVDGDGVVVYGTSSEPLVDAATGTSLPVFDRLAIYRLEPTCVRGLARRIDKLGITDIEPDSGAPATAGTGIVLFWRAFGAERVLPGQGRLRGPMAEIIAVVAAHLPKDEVFDAAFNRQVVPVLRGAPKPREGLREALAAYDALVEQSPDDEALLLDGYALACSLGQRDQAEQWLGMWTAATAARDAGPAFADHPSQLDSALLASFLPPR